MDIQWFPGHMTKALRMMEEEIKVIDLVMYVLDSRAPFSCVNPSFKDIIGSKPIIYILNKADLADEVLIKKWANYFNQGNARSIILDSTLSGSGKKVVEKMKELLNDKLERNRKKGIVMPLRAMIIGVPNSGKSTLINNLCGKGKTVTGNRPGVTRGKQWVKIADNIELMDTPGTLWPSFEDEKVAKHLAFIGSIRDQVLDLEELALELIKDILELNPKLIENRYGFSVENLTPLEIFENVCKVRGLLIRGGEFDYARGATVIIDDFRKGKLGKITLDTL
ncbi:MAG: ribosome biogenesis GTPase YlqF [Tenericutes bacterium HGW-Tenericutes-4]|nr:MAG: ribosome biogenesis GTPase YlqF [Tenericutes bacterium HGW-Tenericutes-4]